MIARRTLFCKPRPVRPPAAPSERWTITLCRRSDSQTGHDTTVPVGRQRATKFCRVRRLLKAAWRGYGLKAEIVAGPPTTTTAEPAPSPAAATPPPQTAKVSIGTPGGPQTKSNCAGGKDKP